MGDVEHTVGKTPLVIEPGQQVDQARAGHAGLAAIDNRRMGVVVEIAAGMGQLGVGQQALERAAAATSPDRPDLFDAWSGVQEANIDALGCASAFISVARRAGTPLDGFDPEAS